MSILSEDHFSCILDARAGIGESPVWCVEEQCLYWIDISGRCVHRFDPATGSDQAISLPEQPGSLALARDGGFVVGLRSAIRHYDRNWRNETTLAINPEDNSISRFNDCCVDLDGRLWIGTIDETRANNSAHLYRLDQRGLVAVADGFLTSNGLAFSLAGDVLYQADTPRFIIYKYRVDRNEGGISDRQIFASISHSDTERGRPDGAAVDSEGCYWTPLFEGYRVRRYSPEGLLLQELPVPVRFPTMVAFGGDDLKTLYLTSARDARSPHHPCSSPLSGGLFATRVRVPGLAPRLFSFA